jgi:hypothetical protein
MALSRLKSAQALEFAVFLLELLELLKLRRAQSRVFLTPLVKRGVADAHLAADLLDLGAQLRLLDRKGNLLFCKPACLHGMPLFP